MLRIDPVSPTTAAVANLKLPSPLKRPDPRLSGVSTPREQTTALRLQKRIWTQRRSPVTANDQIGDHRRRRHVGTKEAAGSLAPRSLAPERGADRNAAININALRGRIGSKL